MILVTGATGNIGPSVVRALQGAGHPVRAAIHKSPLTSAGVQTCARDFDDPAAMPTPSRPRGPEPPMPAGAEAPER